MQTANGCVALLANFPNFTANISRGESKLVRLKFSREIFSTEGANWTGLATKWVHLGLHWLNDLPKCSTYTSNDLKTALWNYIHLIISLVPNWFWCFSITNMFFSLWQRVLGAESKSSLGQLSKQVQRPRTLGGRREGGCLSFFFSQQCPLTIAILNLQPPVPRQTPLVQSSVPQILTMPPSRVGPSPSYGTPHTILDLTGTDRTKKKEKGPYWPTCHTRAAALTLQPLPRGCPGKDLTHWFELQPELRVRKTIWLQAAQSQINLPSIVKFILNCLKPNFKRLISNSLFLDQKFCNNDKMLWTRVLTNFIHHKLDYCICFGGTSCLPKVFSSISFQEKIYIQCVFLGNVISITEN